MMKSVLKAGYEFDQLLVLGILGHDHSLSLSLSLSHFQSYMSAPKQKQTILLKCGFYLLIFG
jgi:hypothetical protein